ncbi:MAG: hypothetical protein LBV77_06095 [Candidatus Adiutrix intracellularis]|nr:hypothetical protein [Candidatus Adiutrix intracellularis]
MSRIAISAAARVEQGLPLTSEAQAVALMVGGLRAHGVRVVVRVKSSKGRRCPLSVHPLLPSVGEV